MDRRTRRLPPEQRREQLLEAALALAAGGDVAEVSVQAIAERAGVSEGLLYHYFPNKQALFAAAVRSAADHLAADLRTAALTPGPVLDRLAAGLTAYLDHVQAQPVGWRAVLHARTGELSAIAEELEQTSRALVLQALGIEAPSPTLLVALQGWSALEREACVAWLDRPGLARAALEGLLFSTFLAALQAAAEHDEQSAAALARLMAGG